MLRGRSISRAYARPTVRCYHEQRYLPRLPGVVGVDIRLKVEGLTVPSMRVGRYRSVVTANVAAYRGNSGWNMPTVWNMMLRAADDVHEEDRMAETAAAMHGARQARYWNSAATSPWVEQQARLDAFFAPLNAAGLAKARPVPGERVLDVGCGCGDSALALARAVGSAGSVLGVDLSVPMLNRAKARAAEAALSHATFLEGDAGEPGVVGEGFDLVFSRLGVMFFGDAPAAFATLRRATRPGGRMVFVCPRTPAECAFISAAVTAARPLLPEGALPVPGPDEPWMFSLADPARVHRVLGAAGWRDIALEKLDEAMVLEETAGPEAAAAFSLQFGPLPRVLAEVEAATRVRVMAAIANAYRAMGFGARVVLPGGFWVVSAAA